MLFPPKLLWMSAKNSANVENCMCNPANELHWIVSWNHLEQKWLMWGGEYWGSPGITFENPARTLPLTVWVFTICTALFVPTNLQSQLLCHPNGLGSSGFYWFAWLPNPPNKLQMWEGSPTLNWKAMHVSSTSQSCRRLPFQGWCQHFGECISDLFHVGL